MRPRAAVRGLASDNNIAPTPRPSASRSCASVIRPSGRPGTLTAGNSAPLTDGASAVLLASEDWARARNLPVQAWLTYGKAWAVDFVGGRDDLAGGAPAVPAMLHDDAGSLRDLYCRIHGPPPRKVLYTR